MSKAPSPNETKLPEKLIALEVGNLQQVSATKVIFESKEKNILQSKKVNILLRWLAEPKMNCIFWQDHNGSVDIVGLRPVLRTTIDTINAGGFTPYEKKADEKLFKFYMIDVVDNNDKYILTREDEEKREMIEQNGSIYLKSENIKYIYDYIRKNS
jgi:hypothetical protein